MDGFLIRGETGTNFTYEADIKLSTANTAGALVFRSNSSASSSYVVNLDSSGQAVRLFKFPNVPLVNSSQTLTTGVWYHVRVTTSGTTINVYFNNKATPVITFTDNTYSSGQFGINSWNGTAQIDNVITWTP